MRMRNTARFGIFTRLVLCFFCTLFVIYCIMAWLLIRNTNAARDEFLESRHQQAQSYMEDIERQLNAFYTQESYLINNQDVRKLAYSLYGSNYEKFQLVLSLLRTLDYIDSLSPLIQDTTVYLPSQAISISSANGYVETKNTDAQPLREPVSVSPLAEEDGGLVMRISYPLMYSLSEEYMPDMVITISFSEKALKESLEIFSDDAGSGAALVYNDSLIIGNVYGTTLSTLSPETGESTGPQSAAANESFRTDLIAASAYPLKLMMFINNRALTQIAAQNILLLTAVTLLASGIFFLFLLFTRRWIHKPLSEMVGAFEKLREGRFDVRIHHKSHDEFHFIYSEFNDTVEKLRQLIEKVLEQDKLINAAELAQLQSQINPHFLYNSFFIISRMAKSEEYEQINAFVTSLARYYRFLNKALQDAIPLKDEIEHMNNYIDIQQMRFGDKIRIEQGAIPKEILDCLVPKLVLQPLIENAYEYGLADKLENGLIRISYALDGKTIDIAIEDNGDCATEAIAEANSRLSNVEDSQKSHALYNINRRLKLFYGEASGLVIGQSALGGFRVCLHVQNTAAASIIGD